MRENELTFTDQPIRFWRIQQPNGSGPISGHAGEYLDFRPHCAPQSFMWYDSEGDRQVERLFNNRWRCGWSNIKVMKNFPANDKCIAGLDLAGFSVCEMESSDCAVFKDSQVLFDPETVICIREHVPSEFFEGYDEQVSNHLFEAYAMEFF